MTRRRSILPRIGLAAVLLLTLETASGATFDKQMASIRGLPTDVRAFIERRANCNHWLGEQAYQAERIALGEEDYDAERTAQIMSALGKFHCMDAARDEAALKQRYAANPSALNALESSKDWSPD
jgi:hypothetical protein